MHISKFEKFIIKHWEITSIVAAIILLLLQYFLMKQDLNFLLNTIPVVAIFVFADGLCIFITSNIRKRMDNFYSKDLNPDAAITLVKEYLEIEKSSIIFEKIYYYYDLATYHSAKGEFEQIIDIYTKVRRESSKIKVGTYHDLSLRIFLALSYLNRGEKDLYDKELQEIRKLMSQLKITRHVITHQFTELKLLEESLYGGNDPKFETKVFYFLYEKNSSGKVKNKKPTNMQMISAYGLLLNYYKLNEDSEKATEYANKIIELGNENLVTFRKAKEYLDNAN